MERKVVVVLGRDLTQAVEAGVRDLWEVMVLVVVAHIVCQRIERAIVGVRLLALHVY